MPISSSAASLERKRIFRIRGSLSTVSSEHGASTDENFLTIEPALPHTESSKKLRKRSNSTLGAVKSTHEAYYATETLLQPYPDGTIHILRAPQEKEKNPDRISLDRRGLTVLPILENEANLRLLSLQHNLISCLEAFSHQEFSFLVFLDVYDNQLEKIHCLDRLENLRVLLMGKNRIRRIHGLESLVKIEVLDLHGNQIVHVNGLSTLNQLKVLNLAGNQIRSIGPTDLKGLTSLQEFNLRRNRLKKLLGFGETPSLQKLFLNNNELQAIEDICSLAKATKIREISVDNNPISLGGDCISFLVSYLPHLLTLNTMQITEQVRKAAMAWRRNKESSNAAFMDLTSDVCLSVRREEVISNARTNWELLRSQTKCLAAKTSNAINFSRNLKPDCDFILTSLGKPELKNSVLRTKPRSINVTKVPALPDKKLNFARTSSQDTENSQNTSSSTTSSGDFFRLPPILVPIINKMEQRSEPCASKESSIKLSGSLSSIGPNVDSSVSSLQSNSDISNTDGDTSESDSETEDIPDVPTKTTPPADGTSHLEHSFAITNHFSKEEDKQSSSSSNKPTDASSNVSTATSASQAACSTSGSEASNSSIKTRSVKSAAVPRTSLSKVKGRPLTTKPKKEMGPADNPADKDREQGGDYLIEICGRHLNIYGQGALRFIDKPWSMSKAKDVNTVNFSYAGFNSITTIFNKLKQRFSNADNFVFKDTNIQHLGQLNALAEVQGLSSLVIEEEGNPIVKKSWRSYAVYRLAHWGLRFINSKEITEEDIKLANQEYKSLSDIVLWSLPNVLLQPLLIRLQLDVGQKITEHSAKKWLLTADPSLRCVVVKEALQWKRGAVTQEDLLSRQKAKTYIGSVLDETCHAVNKLRLLDEQWPAILLETVRNILLDYTQIDMYMKRKLQELK